MDAGLKDKVSPLLNKKIALFLISQNLSLFGSSVVDFAIFWHITLETSSGMWLTLYTVCAMLPEVLLSLWGGVLADRYNRKYLIMLADAFIALATLALTVVFWTGIQRMELLLAVAAVRSIGSGIQAPATNAIFPQLVPQERLTRIQGINQTLNSVLLLLSPATGGVILASLGIVWTFALDVVTAALAILIFSFIKVEKMKRADLPASLLTELRQGINYTFRHPLLRGIVICQACSFFLITPAAILSPLLVERSFGSNVWKLTANEIAWTVGSLIGGIFVSLHGSFKDKIHTIALCLVAFGISYSLMGMAGNFPLYLTIMGISGLFMPVIITAQTVFIQEIAEPTMLGRVFSIVQIIAASAMPVAILFFGPLADVISVEAIMIVSGVFLALTGILYKHTQKKVRKEKVVFEND